jgi:hypothetical protein
MPPRQNTSACKLGIFTSALLGRIHPALTTTKHTPRATQPLPLAPATPDRPDPQEALPECPCFTPGTRIATATGERDIQDLVLGDKIVTRDNGLQEIRWIGTRSYGGRELARNPHLYPILIRAGALVDGLPERDMRLSPNHRVLVSSDRTALYFEEREVLAAAKHLVNHRGVFEVESLGTTYIHLLFDHHQVILSNGCWSESFQPTDRSLAGMGNAQRQEILEIFPDIITNSGGLRPARKVLSEKEAQRLFEDKS